MAIRFARQAGNWSNPLTWDGGLTIPGAGDDVYSNGFNITLDQDINVGCLNGGSNPQGVPLSPIPNMTSNTSPSGVGQAFAVQNNATAWQVFKKPITNFTNTGWSSPSQIGQIGYQFDTPKNIQRYSWLTNSGANQRPRNWTFEGSNDGVSWVTLHTVTAYANLASYFSPNISNPSSYTYYRINVSTTQTGAPLFIDYLDMTESTDAISSGYGVNGQFNSSVNRNITCTGFGIIRPNFHTGGTLVNINGNGTTTNITSNIVQYTNVQTSYSGIVTVGGGNNILNVTGDVYIDSVATTLARGRCITSGIASNTINVIGNIYSTSAEGVDMAIITHSNILNITGNVYNYSTATSTANRIIGGNTVTSKHNITGNIIVNSPTNTGFCFLTGELSLTGNFIGVNGIFPFAVNKLQISPSVSISFQMQATNNANRFLYTSAQSTGQAAESNVRLGIIYGPNNDYTGTCAVPPSGSVTLGVPVDNTTGTAYTDPTALAAAFFTEISGSSDPLAQRMKNQATVQTTGDQIAALM
jgi:hypothetical protein